jgi:inner membrane organizing system protein 1
VLSLDEYKAPTEPKAFKDISSDIAKKRGPSQSQVNEQYDLCIDLTLRRFVYGSLTGLATAVLMFRGRATRSSAVAFGAGVGLGSAYADCSHILGDRMTFPSFPKWPPR